MITHCVGIIVTSLLRQSIYTTQRADLETEIARNKSSFVSVIIVAPLLSRPANRPDFVKLLAGSSVQGAA